MIPMRVVLNGDMQFPELQGRKVHSAQVGTVTALPGGMKSGRASVAFIIELEDGSVVFAETSLRMLQAATKALTGRYGEEG